MSEQCERTSERRRKWSSTQRVDFIVILPNVGRTDRETDGPTDRQTDIRSYGDARTHLKNKRYSCTEGEEKKNDEQEAKEKKTKEKTRNC